MSEKIKLNDICEVINSAGESNVRLYFITKKLKSGVSRTARVLEKYDYNCSKVNIDESLQKYFLDLLKTQLNSTINNSDIDFTDFDIIDDDLKNKVYTYAINNASSFYELVNEKMKAGVDIPYISRLKDVMENLCAYSISLEIDNKVVLISFRKINRSVIGTEEKGLRAHFRASDRKLIGTDGESINFDEKVDCIYCDNNFFIFHKKQFENLLEMHEEYKEIAKNVLNEISESNFVSGLDIVFQEVDKSKIFVKQLAKIYKAGGHKNIDNNRIIKMQQICSKLNLHLKIEAGKIVIDDANDAKLLMRLLDQYYLECMQTGDPFGSHAKRKLELSGS